MTEALDMDHLRSWIGREKTDEDTVSPRLAASLAAVLDEPVHFKDGDAAPTGVHWCLSPEIAPMSALGPDGHPARGDFLPPIPFPRRMWAGSEIRFHDELRVGDRVRRSSRVQDVRLKEGRSGALCFVEVFHTYRTDRGTAIEERHDIVYRPLEATSSSAPAKPAAQPAMNEIADRSVTINADAVVLMRYSAVTFNGHRIHYDRDYCLHEEGYPGLVVHGPLQATLLLRLARQMNGGAYPAGFSFRGVSPLFDGAPFTLNARMETPLSLWALDVHGRTTMTARATF